MGDAPITGLTPREELTLQLGFLIKQEQAEEAQRRAERKGKGRKSKPRYSNPQQALDAYTEKHDLGNKGYD